MNTTSEYTYFYISKSIFSYTFVACFFLFFFLSLISPYQRNTIQMLLFELFDKLIRLELAEDSQTESFAYQIRY